MPTVPWSWGILRLAISCHCVPSAITPHDPEAVAIYYGKTKLGYVPGNEVGPLSLMMYYGHEDVFEARVQQVAPERSPWHQVRVGLYVVDAR